MALYRHIILSLALVITAFPAPVAAQRMQPGPGRWNIDYGELRCSLSRRLGGPQSPILILTSYLGRDEPEFILMRDGAEELPDLPDRVEVVLTPSNHVARGVPRARRVLGGRILSIQELGEGFVDRFAASQTVRFQTRGRTLVDMAIPQATTAVAALKTCNEDLLRSWGVDTSIPLSRRPRYRSGSIRHSDYPAEAIRRNQQGVVVARIMVGADGRAQNCATAASSTFPVLDLHTCALITDRFRFEPAQDEQGRPVSGLYVQTVRWIMPDW